MLFEPERHQALSSDRWDEQFVRAAINRIAADTILCNDALANSS
jgi:hypothetical protein